MTDPLGLIPIPTMDSARPVSPLDRVLGVPLALWAVNNLRRAMPMDRVAIATDDASTARLADLHRVPFVAFAGALDQPNILVHDPFRPFCSLNSVNAAIAQGVRELSALQTSPTEQIDARSRPGFDLAQSAARGLAPDHPCVVGVRAMRLPMGVDLNAVVTDVDGVLTDGLIHIDSAGVHGRGFNMHDGMGTRLLQHANIEIGWLSAGVDDGAIRSRADHLGVRHVDVGQGDKGQRFVRLCAQMGVEPGRTIYLGDDVNDLPAMNLAALTACPADATVAVRNRVDLVLETRGGGGAFRELADLLLDDVHLRNAQAATDRGSEHRP